MVESIEIENFRGFREVTLRGLRRINVIVGRNASGKTALLESIYLTSGGQALTFKLKLWRGLGDRVEFSLDSTQLNSLWRDLFFRFQPSSSARISLKGSDDLTRSLEIKSVSAESRLISRGGKLTDIESLAPITFQWFKRKHPISGQIRPTVEGNQLKLEVLQSL